MEQSQPVGLSSSLFSISDSTYDSSIPSNFSDSSEFTTMSPNSHLSLASSTTILGDDLLDDVSIRQSKNSHLETIGALRAQEDWSRLIGNIRGYRGSLGGKFNIMAATVPDLLPERVEALAYVVEYAFLYDDQLERDQESVLSHTSQSGHKKMKELVVSKMATIDPVRTAFAMKAWSEWAASVKQQPRDTSFQNFDEYFKCRVEDLGAGFWASTLIFGLALSLTDIEVKLCHHLTSDGFAAITLVNDLYSWDKERDEASLVGQEEVMNSVWVLMREHGISENKAKDILRCKIREKVEEYRKVVANVNQNQELPGDVKRFVNAVMGVHAGNVLWSRYCPRYHQDETWNATQLEMMEKGVDAVLLYQ